MALHAFVAMPFGQKENIDFNKVYSEYIKPALTSAGFEVFRADEEQQAGTFARTCSRSCCSPISSWWTCRLTTLTSGMNSRNAAGLRSRGVIQIQCKHDYLPFDVYVDRTLVLTSKTASPTRQPWKPIRKLFYRLCH